MVSQWESASEGRSGGRGRRTPVRQSVQGDKARLSSEVLTLTQGGPAASSREPEVFKTESPTADFESL